MKFNLEKWLLCLSAVAGLAGCQQEETAISPQTEAVLFGTQDDFRTDARTRSVIGGMLADGSLSVQWGVGDRIGVFGTQSVNAPFTSTNSEPAAETDFKGTITAGEELLYAYYPYAEGVTNVQAIPVTIPSEQAYADETSVGQYDVKASASITAQADGSYKLAMRQMVTLLRFEINLTEVKQIIGGGISEEVPGTERLRKAVVTTSSNLTGSYTYDLANLDGGLKAGEKSANSLTLSFTNAPALSETVIAYAIVVPGKHQGTKLLCELQTDSYSVAVTATMLCDFEAGKYYVVPLNASVYNNTENETVVEKLPEPEPQEETANCYMINTPGEHSFLATQIGNGDKGIIPGAGFHVTSAAISPKSAKLLWQDVEGFIQASSVRLGDDGRVHYTAAKNVGNALIAVYSGENCAGDILWSWHIWGVGDTMPQDEEVTNQAKATFLVMDRALGAPSLTSSAAMLYQWGRNIPIPNSRTYYVDGTLTDIEESYPVLAGETLTIQDGVQNPAKLLHCTAYSNNQDWLAEENEKLWGDTNKKDQYTWYSTGKYSNAEAGAGWTDVKTIYDPSPVGYRVPNKFTFTGFVTRTSGDTPQGNSTYKWEYINYVKYDNGWYFKKNADDIVGSYFPMTGSRGATTGSLWVGGNAPYLTLDYTASYWSSACQKNAHQSHEMSFAPYSDTNSAAGNNSYNAVNTVDFAYRANAFAVRCVRDGSSSGKTCGSSYENNDVGFGLQ